MRDKTRPGGEAMRKTIAALGVCVGAASGARADEPKDYTGPFTTQVLYTMCSQNDATSREKYDLYIQGLLYGLNTQKSMQENGMPVCLPKMNPEAACVRILQFIDGTTGGSLQTTKTVETGWHLWASLPEISARSSDLRLV
jgi:hypothetical protein